MINLVLSGFITEHLNARNWGGVALVCASLCLYAYISFTSKKPPAKAAAKGDAETGVKPSEATPLTPAAPDDGSIGCGCTIA